MSKSLQTKDPNCVSLSEANNFLEVVYGRKVANEQKMISLNEITMNRLLGKRYAEAGLAIVSASRADKSEEENAAGAKEMFALIQQSGFRYVPAFGEYVEQDENGKAIRTVYEAIAVVLCNDHEGRPIPFEELRKFALDLGVRFEQDCVLLKAPDDNPKYIVTNERNGELGSVYVEFTADLKVNELTQLFFTTMAGKQGADQHRFTFTEQYLNPSFVTLNEGHVRYMKGELFLTPNQAKGYSVAEAKALAFKVAQKIMHEK